MKEYNEIDQQIHQLSQVIAKFNRTFVTQKVDDSHTNLSFDYIGRKVWGRWATIKSELLIPGLDLQTQQIMLVNKHYQTIANFATIGKTQPIFEKEMAGHLSKSLQLDAQELLKPMHYEIPNYGFKKDGFQKWNASKLDLWIHYRHLANETCALLATHLNKTAEIRIWPHHFDTGIYMELNDKIAVGFGWAMADDMINEGYFYFSAYGLNDHKINYDSVSKLTIGRWIISSEWKGAVLGLAEANHQNIFVFLGEITQWVVSQT
ncbi:hypothetical protein [uncultured Planktosalinus sp.]|uniref:hypothetical protein n=1 Tax=uncultured Planktosalinus sp. TaxID=1810935 RepID=UPI0030DC8A50